MKPKIKKPAVITAPVIEAFDKFLAFEKIEQKLLSRILEGVDDLSPYDCADVLSKVSLSHERMMNIARMHRDNMESVNGTTRRIVFDWSIEAPREPGKPADA